MDPVLNHLGQWWAVALYALVYGLFILFMPYYKKSQVKPSGVYLAFVVAFALEMFGVLSINRYVPSDPDHLDQSEMAAVQKDGQPFELGPKINGYRKWPAQPSRSSCPGACSVV